MFGWRETFKIGVRGLSSPLSAFYSISRLQLEHSIGYCHPAMALKLLYR